MDCDVLILGAGAAGLFCAMTAAKRGLKVVVLEGNDRIGKKILISGGGRCNFTNRHTHPSHFISENPHFVKSALSRFSPGDFLQLVEESEITFYEKEKGQLFCRHSSKEIVRLLETHCRKLGVRIVTSCLIQKVTTMAPPFFVQTNQGPFQSANLVIATGGLSYPSLGATGLGYELALQFGHRVIPTRPGLTPLCFASEAAQWKELAGTSFEATVVTNGISFTGQVLITHRGLSGPAILQISNFWLPGNAIAFNLLPQVNVADEISKLRETQPNTSLGSFLSRHLTKNFSSAIADSLGITKPLGQLSNREIQTISSQLTRWSWPLDSIEGYEKAEVTLGGVATDEISSKTMESTRQKGLYFIGEVLDVTGQLGGFNFQWAWASGFAAGSHIQPLTS